MNNRLAIVTGGASGIGFSTVGQLLNNGWNVLAVDRDQSGLDLLSERLSQPDKLSTRYLDVTSEHAVNDEIASIDSELTLKGLVNSAGIGDNTPFLDVRLDRFRGLLDVNLIGVFVLCQAAARRMLKDGGGSIVNVSSGSGLRANAGRAAYGASKGGVEILSKVMAVELAPMGIRVNTVAPGPIETPLVATMHSPEDRARAVRSVPQGRYGRPEEVAKAIAFLLDEDQASYITGHTLCVDGGFQAAGSFGSG